MQPAHVIQHDRAAESISPYLLWAIWLMWLPFVIQPTVAMVQLPPSPVKVFQAGGFTLFVGVYLWATWREAYRLTRATPMDVGPERRWWVLLGILTGLSVVLPLVPGPWGLGGFIYTSASIAGRPSARQAALVYGGLMFLVVLVGGITATPWASVAFTLFLVGAVGATTASFSRAIRSNRELRLARREIARLAVSEERLRFARDLHDLLGHTLSLITLKSELAGQLIPEDPEQAQREVRDIEAAARTALQEVRETVAGYRRATLASELQRAHELLAAAGIQCTVHDDSGVLPAASDALLSWIVREGVTNVIRHSQAKHCAVSLTQGPDAIRMAVTDDGQGNGLREGVTAARTSQPGNGLRGITERVAALDGRCEAGPSGDRGFRLAVSLPLRPGRDERPATPQLENARGAVS
jgi:two-component system sensor histidine kinase DesK